MFVAVWLCSDRGEQDVIFHKKKQRIKINYCLQLDNLIIENNDLVALHDYVKYDISLGETTTLKLMNGNVK